VDVTLHAWGSNILTGFDRVNYPDGMFLTSTDFPPQDWWTGWAGNRPPNGPSCDNGACAGPARYYSMKRILSFIEWAKTRWPIDPNRLMCSGWSMGGSGAKMFCLRHPEVFNFINSWVGIGNPRGSATFLNEYEDAFGPVSQGMLTENGVNVWDDLDMAAWLRADPRRETPFITYANGVNDSGIGWPHAVDLYKALRDTKRPFTFVWGQQGHDQKSEDMSLTGLSTNAGTSRLDFQKNKALPAFSNFSLDQNPETDTSGGVNIYQRWDPNTIVDQLSHFEIELWMLSQAPSAQASTHVTLRKLQSFRTLPNQQFTWRFVQGTTVLQQGTGVADANGLVTVASLMLSNSTRRKLIVDVAGTTIPPPTPPQNVRIIR
jgi:pimeloyl-ACP methyl ester carboxylesterase